jgi:hypothetical protein
MLRGVHRAVVLVTVLPAGTVFSCAAQSRHSLQVGSLQGDKMQHTIMQILLLVPQAYLAAAP